MNCLRYLIFIKKVALELLSATFHSLQLSIPVRIQIVVTQTAQTDFHDNFTSNFSVSEVNHNDSQKVIKRIHRNLRNLKVWMEKCIKSWISVDFKESISAAAHQYLNLPSEHKDISQRT